MGCPRDGGEGTNGCSGGGGGPRVTSMPVENASGARTRCPADGALWDCAYPLLAMPPSRPTASNAQATIFMVMAVQLDD